MKLCNTEIGDRNLRSGFTLIELMIGIAVVAVMLAFATPPITAWLNDRGVHDAADQLTSNMQRAKLLAIKENANCSIAINSPGPNQYTISLSAETIDLGHYRGGVAFTNTPEVSAAEIRFTPQGVCEVPGAILLTNQNATHTFRVRVTGAGGISEQRYNPGTGKWN